MRRARPLVLALAIAVLAAAGASAELRRFEAVGAVALDPAAPVAAPRQAALRAALEEALVQAVRDVLREAGHEPLPDPLPALPGAPTEYTVSYRVSEDRGEQDAADAGLPGAKGGRAYVVLAEVQIDLARVREALGSAGTAAGGGGAAGGGPETFRLEVLGIPRPAAWTALRRALGEAAGGRVLPLELQPGWALLEVESRVSADATLERLLRAELPPGLALEPLAEEGGVRRLQVRGGPPREPSPEAAVD